jgi:phosphoribosylformylglycinamidine synthase
MTRLVVDEAFRRLVVTGADPEKIGGVDNFCWPAITYDEKTNPDGKLKAAKLVRSCLALKDICLEYKIPLLSGKDSMYVDGHLKGPYGETRKVSAPESLQFSATGIMDDCKNAVTSGFKFSGDRIYLLGKTFDELGGSEFYSLLNEKGVNIPKVYQKTNLEIYKKYFNANEKNLVNSGKSLGKGGLFTALAFSSIAGGFGAEIYLEKVLKEESLEDFKILFSESSGRILVSVSNENIEEFENLMGSSNCCHIGFVREDKNFIVNSGSDKIISLSVDDLESAFEKRFGELV